MKTLVISLMTIFIFESCTFKKTIEDIELIKIKDAEKEFYFAEIKGGKVNNKNEIQCSKYCYASLSDDSLISYGNNLKTTISYLFNIDKKLVKTSKEIDSTTFYSFKYFTDKIDSFDIEYINKKLEESLNIKIKRKKAKVKVYEIFIVNNNLLSYSNNTDGSPYSRYRDKNITLKNLSLKGLTPYLSNATSYFFICNESDTLRVDIELEVSKDLNNLKKELAKNGLSIKETEITKELIYIE